MLFALDAMGGDFAPEAPCRGALLACSEDRELEIALVGRRSSIEPFLADAPSEVRSRIEIVDASEVIGMGDNPAASIRGKKDSSLRRALDMVKSRDAVGCISAGNTGAIVAGGVLVVGRIKGIDRPGLAVPIPGYARLSLLLDVGATVRCKPINLFQFARMGSIYMKSISGVDSPTIGLFANGSEEIKGDEQIKEARHMLEASDLNFYGLVEGKDVPLGTTDVIVCDGFTGNALIKMGEGIGELVKRLVKEELKGRILPKIGAALMMGTIKRVAARFEHEKNGGSPLLGVDGLVIKAHGNSKDKAIAGALHVAKNFADSRGVDLIRESLERSSENGE